MDKATRDPRTLIWLLRKRVPTRYRNVARQKSGYVKISTGTKDDAEARRRWPEVLARYAALEQGWERKLTAVALTPESAAGLAAHWAAWIAAGHGLNMGGANSDVFEPMMLPEMKTPGNKARMWERVEAHAAEALELGKINVTDDTRPVLLNAMLSPVAAAYLQADLSGLGVSGTAPALNPLQAARNALPPVTRAPAIRPEMSLDALLTAWKAVAAVKPRTMTDTAYILKMLEDFMGHGDAAKITKADMKGWRDASKAATPPVTNNTWNNRLSMVRQVFALAVDDGRLPVNPADTSLRLAKSRPAARLPYSDEDAARILIAARKEALAGRRWAHWIMAFTGMRVAEVLQLTAGDVRQEGEVWYLAVHEDDAGKSVKSGERRSVPIHPALIQEGFLAYAEGVEGDDPLFPDKTPDRHGNRGARGWNHVGQWVRKTVGINDPRKPPNHAWRHRMEDELRAAEVPEELRDAIVGHARKTMGASYGVRGEALARLAKALARVPVPPGVVPGEV